MSHIHEDTDQTRPWWLRAGIHFAYLAICLALTLLVKRELSL